MFKNKILVGFVLALALVALQVGPALAAPLGQTGDISGTVDSIATSTDSSSNTIVVVTYTDSGATSQTVNLSLDAAISAGLASQDTAGNITFNIAPGDAITVNADGSITFTTASGDTINVSADAVIPAETTDCTLSEGANPVAAALNSFFCDYLGQDDTTGEGVTVEDLHSEGFGYGEIAQACFMAQTLGSEGMSVSCGDILTAKQNKDFSSLGLSEDSSVSNWGQLKKYVLSEKVKSLTNLGAIMSGRAQPASSGVVTTESATTTNTTHGKSGDHGKGYNNGKGRGGGH